MDFWERLEKKLKENGMTAAGLASEIGMAKSSVNGWKDGTLPRADVACRIAEMLHTTVEYLVTGEGPEPVPKEVLDLAYEVDALPKVFRDSVFEVVGAFKRSVTEEAQERQLGSA